MENTIGGIGAGSVEQVEAEKKHAASVIRIATTILEAGLLISEDVGNRRDRKLVLGGFERLVTDIINTELHR